jgi:small nuclear ribonucleoprotein (snRNP)-like protein
MLSQLVTIISAQTQISVYLQKNLQAYAELTIMDKQTNLTLPNVPCQVTKNSIAAGTFTSNA